MGDAFQSENDDLRRDSFSQTIAAPEESEQEESLFDRIFRPRDILIRSQGKVTFIKLTQRLQVSVAAGAVFFGVWMAGATINNVVQYHSIEKRDLAITEAKLSGEKIRQDFQQYSTELKSLSALLAQRKQNVSEASHDQSDMLDSMAAIQKLSENIKDSLDEVKLDFEIRGDDPQSIVATRNQLKTEILKLENELLRQETVIARLDGQLNTSRQEIAATNQAFKDLQTDRNALGQQVNALNLELASSRTYGQQADQDIIDFEKKIVDLELENNKLLATGKALEDDFFALKEKEEELLILKRQTEDRLSLLNNRFLSILLETGRDPQKLATLSPEDLSNKALEERLGVLEKTSTEMTASLQQHSSFTENVEKSLDRVLAGLGRVTGYTGTANETRWEQKPAQAITLLGELENIHDNQLEIVSGLLQQTEKSIMNKKTMLAGVGLDLDKRLQAVGYHVGQGGPEELPDFTGGTSMDLNESVTKLGHKVVKLQALDKLIACVPLISPVDFYNITSKFGSRKDPFTGKRAMHKGVDLGGWPGTPVYTTASGKVVKAGHSSSYGRMVEVDHGCGITTIYGHLKKIKVKKGAEINHRAQIGTLGSTGRSTGPHVHYEIRIDGKPLDPLKFIEAGRFVYKG